MKKLASLALAVVTAAGGCNGEPARDAVAPPPTEGVTRAQFRAFEALEGATNQSWLWLQHEALKTPMHLSAPRTGSPMLAPGGDPVKTTLELLSKHKALFKMRDPALELAATRADVDALGMTHARFQQMTHGVPVVGAELMAHYDRAGRLTAIDANYVSDLEGVDVNPIVSAEGALALAKADVLSRSIVAEESLEPEDGRLVVFAPPSAPARLAYRYRLRALAASPPAIWITTVDAKTGEVIHRYDDLQTVKGQGTGVLGDKKQIEVTASGGGYVMTDASGGAQVRTYTAGQQQTTPGSQVTSTSATSWDTGVPGAGAAVDAHFNAAAVLKYYKDKQQRNAIDGKGGALISTAHFGRAFDNAAWDGAGMIYGDGGQLFYALSVSLDVVGHEFTHGVTEKTSGLLYENQSGALNEAVSDIFGAFIERSISPDDVKNWQLGEAVVKQGRALRNMKDPSAGASPQPAHMSQYVHTQQDNGGVHINSGIVNNAAYLMTVGGTNPVSKTEVKYGIGWDKSEQLWYRANTKYFLQSASFGQAAQGVLQAAQDIGLTEVETNIVDCALKATGMAQGKCATIASDPQAKTPEVPAAEEPDDTVGAPADEEPADTADDGATEELGPRPKRRRMITQTTSGCAAAPGGSAGVGPALALLAAAVALGAKRRTKS